MFWGMFLRSVGSWPYLLAKGPHMPELRRCYRNVFAGEKEQTGILDLIKPHWDDISHSLAPSQNYYVFMQGLLALMMWIPIIHSRIFVGLPGGGVHPLTK